MPRCLDNIQIVLLCIIGSLETDIYCFPGKLSHFFYLIDNDVYENKIIQIFQLFQFLRGKRKRKCKTKKIKSDRTRKWFVTIYILFTLRWILKLVKISED